MLLPITYLKKHKARAAPAPTPTGTPIICAYGHGVTESMSSPLTGARGLTCMSPRKPHQQPLS